MMRPLLVMLCAALCGCSMFVAKDDYRGYRATRTASDIDARLVAMEHYTRAHPDGHWIDEVEAERSRHDTATFSRGKSSRGGLEHYLRVFPQGAFAEQARARLSAIAMIETRRQQEAREAAQAEEARLARERQLRRTWVTRFVDYWGGALSGLSNWGAPIADVAAANARFSSAFGRSPRPRCTETECIKYYEAPYGIPIPGGTRLERTMQVALRLHLQQGKLTGAELLMPGYGFSRWYELEHRELVVDEDPEQRAQAVAWAMDKLRRMVAGYAAQVTAVTDFVLPPILKPTISPTGEQIDASVGDPSLPSNRIASDAPDAASAVTAAQEQGPDMVVAAIQIGADGRAVDVPRADPGNGPASTGGTGDATAAPGEAGGEVMVLDAMSIPSGDKAGDDGTGSGATGSGSAAGPQVTGAGTTQLPQLEAAPEAVEGFNVGGLEFALRAAPVADGPGYDLVWIRVKPVLAGAP